MKLKGAPMTNAGSLPLPADAQSALRSITLDFAPLGEAIDPAVGGGVDRSKIPAADFAGKDRSFPIVSPADVSDAAASIGRAGPDNYSTDELKANIIAIAKRKGAAFVAELPKAWQPSTAEAEDIESDLVMLNEATAAGTIPVKLISPGWGSSGYYGKEQLQRDIPQVFPAGTHMFVNHATEREDKERPCGDLRNLAAVLSEDPHWEDNGPDGPGVYSRFKPFANWASTLKELAPHIGVSIRAWGKRENGEAEGKRGPIVKELSLGRSVDFVTKAGRDGRILELIESARDGRPLPVPDKETEEMNEAEVKELNEKLETAITEAATAKTLAESERARAEAAIAENAKLKEGVILAEAATVVDTALAATKLPDVTKQRLAVSLKGNPPIAEGELDKVKYAATITETITAAEAEVAAITGGKPRVSGMGGQGGKDARAELMLEYKKTFSAQGYNETQSTELAEIAVSGR